MQSEAVNGMTDREREEEKQTERAAIMPDFTEEITREAGQTELESLYINTVYVGKEGRQMERVCESVRVTVEITHPALHLPVYCTWTGN